MDKPNVKYFLLLLFSCCAWTRESKHDHCLKHLDTCGFTVPRGDIVLEYGQPLNITCNMYEDIAEKYGENASSGLYFTHGNQVIPHEMVEIVNSTSIRLYIERPWKVANENFYCNFNESLFTPHSRITEVNLVCMNVVIVGVSPQNVTDFSCIGRNYENLTCSWTEPENYVKTQYNLSYTFSGRAARTCNKVRDPKGRERKTKIPKNGQTKTPFPCPKLTTEDKIMSCFWNISSRPQYRLVQPTYIFTLNMTNQFGTNTLEYVFDHFKHVVPNKPENLTAVATSPHSINLTWTIPSSMVGFPCGLHHRILYQCEYEKKWHSGGVITTATKNETLNFELTNLKYAHNLYDIRVSMRSAEAVDSDTVWSENASITEWTKSKIPDCPPATTIGSFEINEYNSTFDVYVYWQTIKPEQENGQNLTYEVYMDSHPDLRYTEVTKAYAKYTNLSFSTYVISIWSKNEEGFSSEKSTVVIPAERPSLPRNFIKMEHTGLVELKWDAPVHSKREITNYTIFWCDNHRDRPHQCKGRLNWVTVPKNTSKYNVSINDLYQFAISANSHGSSSGMLWAECTFVTSNAVGKMRNIWISRSGSTFIELGWKLDCSDRIPSVTGYVISYCPMKSVEQKQCTEGEKNVTIHDKSAHSGIVDNLKPYTMYRLTVRVIMSLDSYSQPSDFLMNITNEAAPSTPPLNVSVTKITNSSVSLKWLPPTEMNGKPSDYIIYYATDTEKKSKQAAYEMDSLTLSDLESYKTYWITMQACTTNRKCSKPSENITVTTHMWIPGKIDKLRVTFQNDSLITIEWKAPYPPRGRVDYYQLKFTHDQSENAVEAQVNVTNTQKYNIEECGQSGKYNNILVSVRAVNIIDGSHKHGPWSKQLEARCAHSSRLYIIFSVLAVFIIVCAAVIFGFRKMYACCKSMQDVEVKLPPGLAPVIEQRDLVPWTSEKSPEDIDRSSRADEELLLQKMSEVRASADSSGCSSGHESITSSLESNTHLSVDSGTDQPRSVSDENRRNSLRQRNVSCKGYVMPDAIQTTVNWGPKPAAAAGNYCVLGVDPNKADPALPYVPVGDGGSSVSLPYISCDPSSVAPKAHAFPGEFVKTANPGYVPYMANEPAGKNTGYVLAGLSKDILVPDLRQVDAPVPMTSVEDKPYLKMDAPATPKAVQLGWHQPALETAKTGYVTVGDAPPPKALKEAPKGYVPHRQFEAKALKED
ncbi:unnamed protein product [Phaedon cochleariae]|uniref:Fibronectin type-III domain-containing protein n=1 Tax=Phaedon cochleariae TaxID=80249 RepID=A0A9P0DKY2_PHACE|nr:unnamed protein product [Phaedon cochleariae]